MVEKICNLKKRGGGALSETVLWTNPSPTANLASGTVTLSQDMNNFKRLRFYWKTAKSRTSEAYFDIDVDIVKTMIIADETFRIYVGTRESSGGWVRNFSYLSGTTISMGSGYAAGSASTNNGYCIITKICGLK
jgi:hypothetical protein